MSDPGGHIDRIFYIYDGRHGKIFSLGQWKCHLIIDSRIAKQDHHEGYKRDACRNAFPPGETRLLTVTLGKEGTAIYLDGKLEKLLPYLAAMNHEKGIASRRVILGNSPAGNDPWAGKIFGLAMYDRELTSEQVSQHSQAWLEENPLALLNEEGVIALYPMNEGAGEWVYNQVAEYGHLRIPRKFQVLERRILGVPGGSLKVNSSFLRDTAINILGFVPFGFFVVTYLVSKWPVRWSFLQLFVISVALGGCLSLTIETLQAYLPGRISSLGDLICNTLGTAFGVMLFGTIEHLFLRRFLPERIRPHLNSQ